MHGQTKRTSFLAKGCKAISFRIDTVTIQFFPVCFIDKCSFLHSNVKKTCVKDHHLNKRSLQEQAIGMSLAISWYLAPLSPRPWSHTMVARCLPFGLTTYVLPQSTLLLLRPPGTIDHPCSMCWHQWQIRALGRLMEKQPEVYQKSCCRNSSLCVLQQLPYVLNTDASELWYSL